LFLSLTDLQITASVDALLMLAEMCVQEHWMILDVLHEVGGLLRRLQHHALSPKAVPVTYACHVGPQIMSIIGIPIISMCQ
jgi:hypothetical protein